jgi:hypothetical protein
MSSRPLLVALVFLVAVMVASWMLGEFLRQRKDDEKRRRNRRR